MQLTSHIDMTVPFWGLIVSLAYAGYHILQMKFEQQRQIKHIDEMSKKLNSLELEIHGLRNLIIKNFTQEL